MKIRILSDLHVDYNRMNPVKEVRPSKRFTVFAGDVSGDPLLTIETVSSLAESGIVVAGNHIVYNGRKETIEDLREDLANVYTKDKDITFLDATCGIVSKKVGDILFVGSTMYTDYLLKTHYNPDGARDRNMAAAIPRMSGGGMNDFNFGKCRCGDVAENRFLTPGDYLKWNQQTVSMFEFVLNENEKLPNPLDVVIVTHHAPLKRCLMTWDVDPDIDDTRLIDSSYASDMSGFIERHKSVKAWIYGHTHRPSVFDFERSDGSRCVMVNNAHGYTNHGESINSFRNCILDTKDWTVRQSGRFVGPKREERKLTDREIALLSCMIF